MATPCIVIAAAMTAIMGAVLVAGCSREAGQRAAPSTTSWPPAATGCAAPRFPDYPQVNPCSPEQVMARAATVVFTWSPADQQTQGDSFNAASALLDPAYMLRVGDSASVLTPVTGASWARWSGAGITVTATATATPDDHPVDTAGTACRVVAVTQNITYPDGREAEPPRRYAVYMSATRPTAAEAWRVNLISPR